MTGSCVWFYSDFTHSLHLNPCKYTVYFEGFRIQKMFVEARLFFLSSFSMLAFLLCGSLTNFLIQLFSCLFCRTFLKNPEASPWRPSPSCGWCTEHGLWLKKLDSAPNASNIPDLSCGLFFKSDGWNCSQPDELLTVQGNIFCIEPQHYTTVRNQALWPPVHFIFNYIDLQLVSWATTFFLGGGDDWHKTLQVWAWCSLSSTSLYSYLLPCTFF